MADGAAAAVDKTKEVKDDKPQAHQEAAAGALDKLKADSHVAKPGDPKPPEKPGDKPADTTVAANQESLLRTRLTAKQLPVTQKKTALTTLMSILSLGPKWPLMKYAAPNWLPG